MDKEALSQPLDRAAVKSRNQGGSSVSYIEAWHAIAEANRIFGFDGWTREAVETRCVCERERKIGRDQKDGWTVTYTAKVRVMVRDEDGKWLAREGCGAGHGIGTDLGECHESAIKEAESDAMKRALMTFGNPFGLALYDKTQANVEDRAAREAFMARCVEAARQTQGMNSVEELEEAYRSLRANEPMVSRDGDVLKAYGERKKILQAEQAAAKEAAE